MKTVAGRALKIASRSEHLVDVVAVAALASGVVYGLFIAPPDAVQGDVQRLMYVHVPAAWLAYLAFTVVFIASVAYLKTRRTRWDRLAHASAEVGVLFTALTIALGSLWGRPVWGTWWTWDPRLTTTAVLLVIYLGYLAVRRLPENADRRGRWAAVVGVVGFIDVPIVHLSVVWWRTLHQGPTVLRLGKPTMAGSMLAALLWNVGAFTLVYLAMLQHRLRLQRLEERAELQPLAGIVEQIASAPAGAER